ncbi:MAG: glycosyltransferase family 39 protein [Candidatus Omnitrophica bacterium]|nr:glycosyltransferase family 39 protein [Candidatus Omnitrophota bacterium]MDD5080551.1 glycosyltransferase family 39 protein [Candidatus Omnitrophota bacterium]MDD5441152.1 glycosyltransferase family 39 protein [Candidatus Omnitrophota bacterium]
MFYILKRYGYFLVLFSFFIIAAFLYFYNLNGALYLQPDEARAFTLLSTGQLLTIINYPVFYFFQTESSAFYLFVFFGLINTALFYLVCVRIFGRSTGFFAVLFFAFFPFRINYVRSLYPYVFIHFFFILFILLLYEFLNTKKDLFVFLLGLLTGLLFFVHPVSYFLVLPCLVCLTVLLIKQKEKPFKAAKYFIFCFSGIILAVCFVVAGCYLIDKDFSLMQSLRMGTDMTFAGSKNGDIVNFFRNFIDKCLAGPVAIIKTVLVLFLTLLGVISAVRKFDKPVMFSLFVCGLWAVIYFLVGYFNFVPVRYRHFVWLSMFLSLYMGYAVKELLFSRRFLLKAIGPLSVGLLLSLFIYEGFQVSQENFKCNKIISFLKRNNILKERVVTSLHLYEKGDTLGTQSIPTYRYNGKLIIAWPHLYKAYKIGLIDYIIPEGLGAYVEIAIDDPILKKLTPIMSWDHPYVIFKHRHPHTDKNVRINMYRLRDVFALLGD